MTSVHTLRSRFPAARVTVTATGQITIPKRLRVALGLVPGTHVAIDLLEGGFAVRRLTDRARATTGAAPDQPRKETGRC